MQIGSAGIFPAYLYYVYTAHACQRSSLLCFTSSQSRKQVPGALSLTKILHTQNGPLVVSPWLEGEQKKDSESRDDRKAPQQNYDL